MLPVRTILHPTDFSKQAAPAYRVARIIAREAGARLVVLHVDEPPVMSRSSLAYTELGAPLTMPETHHARRGRLERELGEYTSEAHVPVEARIAEGDPVGEILRAAEEVGCDLIVMGTHGRTGLDRLLMGSVAEVVLRKAPCPVLTLKYPAPEPAPMRETPASEEVCPLGGAVVASTTA